MVKISGKKWDKFHTYTLFMIYDIGMYRVSHMDNVDFHFWYHIFPFIFTLETCIHFYIWNNNFFSLFQRVPILAAMIWLIFQIWIWHKILKMSQLIAS